MVKSILKKIKVKKLKIVQISKGNVMHALKKKELSKWNFKEAYFSKIKFNKVKAWRFHKKMNLNLVVPAGRVKFVFYSLKEKKFKKLVIGEKNYSRISVPSKVWFGFKGLYKKESIVLNLADMEHNPKEVLKCEKNKIKFNW